MPDNSGPASAPTPASTGDASEPTDAESYPNWFIQFLNDRQTCKPSAHTTQAYRQDFAAIASLVTDGKPARLTMADITKDSMRTAFAAHARDHEAASIRRCWSTWNVLCTFSIHDCQEMRPQGARQDHGCAYQCHHDASDYCCEAGNSGLHPAVPR